MVRKIIQMSEPQANELQLHANELGISMSEYIRQLIDNATRTRVSTSDIRRRAMEAVGYANSGDADVSVNHDEYLFEAYKR